MSTAIRDAHTHFFSRLFFSTLAGQAPGDEPVDEKLAELGERARIDIPGPDVSELEARWLGAMDKAGIEQMVTFASVPEEAETVAAACQRSGGRLVGYVVVDPSKPAAADRIDHLVGDLGLRGVVLFPALHGYDVGSDSCSPALARLAAHGAVCVVHTGVLKIAIRDLLGLPSVFDARLASPLNVVKAASRHRDVNFVLPHFGGGPLQEVLLAGMWCDNIHLDTSSSNSWIAARERRTTLAEVFERALGVFGPSRILFGTDSSTWPRGYRSDLLSTQQAALDEIGIKGDDRAAILGGNLARLLGET